MASIELSDIRKVYPGGHEAVKGINLAIDDGQFLVLVGPSGCGKSTLLRMIAGLETVTEGTIRIGERMVNNIEPAERDIAMVFQNYALYPHMTVRQNLAYGLKNRRMPKSEIETRVAEAAQILEITEFLDRKPRQLSGGQRQRVAMGRAIVREPKAFLFDEPLSNLDAKLRGQMRVEIRQLQRRLKTTSVYVTHDQLEAMTLADRLVVMNAGEIEQVGTPEELFERPQTLFVAGFIGSPPMNFMTHQELAASHASLNGTLPAGTETVGIRPDYVTLEPDGPSLPLPMEVTLIEPIGTESHVHLTWQNKPVIAAIRGRPPVSEGDRVTAHLKIAALHPFDSAGKRVS